MTQSSYPTMSEEEWENFNDDSPLDCGDNPLCPMNLDDETGVLCGLMLILDYEGETSFSELCGRINILRRQIQSSPTTMREKDATN